MKTVLVTGSAGGLGRSLCKSFRTAGYRVIGTDRTANAADCDRFVELDLFRAAKTPQSFGHAIGLLRQHIGPDGLDALINNAAVQFVQPIEKLTFNEWEETLTTNVSVPFFLTQALLPDLRHARGTVINIGSVHARATKPRFVAYATSKAALVGLTRALAIEVAPAVRVLAVNPAAIDTGMLRAGFDEQPEAMKALAALHPLQRIAAPQEISAFIVFLASDKNGFATGAAFDLDGGILSRLNDPD